MDHCQTSSNDDKHCKVQRFLQSRPGNGNTDFRYRWPTQIFERVCACKGNYGDYNCMRCKHGYTYTGDNCSRSVPVVRRNILSLTETEQRKFLDIMQMTKSVKVGYTVPIREPVTTVPGDSFVEIPLYDIFATFHYNTIRDEQINKCPHDTAMHMFCNEQNKCTVPDFGHEGPTFLTWHRGYMLYVETEIQKMLNDPTFALPYWDWSDKNRQNQDKFWNLMGKSNCGIFPNPTNPTNNTDSKMEAKVKGEFSTWKTVCTDPYIVCNLENQVCNPAEYLDRTDNIGKITRCVGGTQGMQCLANGKLPCIEDVNKALKEQSYENYHYNIDKDRKGFRNTLEGFSSLEEREEDEELCKQNGEMYRPTELHNRVHIYIGGLMQVVPTASNDPIFFLHHCNIDRLYEEWLKKYSDETTSYQPSTFSYLVGPGHNIDEYLVPMFPLMTNRDMHRRAMSLGYTYDSQQDSSGCMGRSQMVWLGIAIHFVSY